MGKIVLPLENYGMVLSHMLSDELQRFLSENKR